MANGILEDTQPFSLLGGPAAAPGVLQRVGHTEAAVDLARLAGLYPAGVICEILNPDGSPSRRNELEDFARRHGLSFVTIAQLVAYRLRIEPLVHRAAEARLPTEHGDWRLIADEALGEWRTYLLLSAGVDEAARLSEETAQEAAAGWGGDR